MFRYVDNVENSGLFTEETGIKMEDPQMLGFAELQICEQIHVCGVLGPS